MGIQEMGGVTADMPIFPESLAYWWTFGSVAAPATTRGGCVIFVSRWTSMGALISCVSLDWWGGRNASTMG